MLDTKQGAFQIAILVFLLLLLMGGCGGGGGGGGEAVTTPTGPGVNYVLIAADDSGGIWQIDPTDGTRTLVTQTGLTHIGSMAYDPGTVTIYAGTGGSDPCKGCLYSVNLRTGATQFILRAHDFAIGYESMTVRPSDGTLLAYESDGNTLSSLDPVTATPTFIGYPPCCRAHGMTFDGSGALYYADPATLYLLNPDTGGNTSVGAFNLTGLANSTFISMATRISDGQIFVINDAGEFATLDQGTREAVFIATLDTPMDALAYVGGGTLPYPPIHDFGGTANWGLVNLFWRDYPIADSYTVYLQNNGSGTIDPADPATYDNTIAGITVTTYGPVQGEINGFTYFLVAAIVNGEVVATSLITWLVVGNPV